MERNLENSKQDKLMLRRVAVGLVVMTALMATLVAWLLSGSLTLAIVGGAAVLLGFVVSVSTSRLFRRLGCSD